MLYEVTCLGAITVERSQPTSILVLLGRLAWAIFCPVALVPITMSIVLQSRGWFTGVDVFFFVVLGLALLGRWLEFRGGDPRTAYGEPATRAHLYRYFVVTSAVGLTIWILANILGNHVVTGWA